MAPRETHTPLRNVRVSDELWDAAKVRAAEDGTTVSALVNAFLQEYVDRPRPRVRKRKESA